MVHEVFTNSTEDLCRKNCESVLIIIYCLCKNVLRMCRKEASPLNEPSPSKQTSNQVEWCMPRFFPSRCSQSSKSGHYDMKWTAVVNHRWHITTSIPVLHLWAAHRLIQIDALWEPDAKSQDKSKIPGCAEVWSCSGEKGCEPLVFLLLCEIWPVCTLSMIMKKNVAVVYIFL